MGGDMSAARAARLEAWKTDAAVAGYAAAYAAKRETFAQHIANGHTARSAFKAMGVSVASTTSWNLAKDQAVVKRVQELVAQRLHAAGVSAERTKQEIARVAYADVRKIFDEEGKLLPIHMIDDDTAAAITSITVQRKNIGTMKAPEFVDVLKIKFASKMDALGLLAKHFKIVNDAGDGVDALASALADRLNSAARRVPTPAPALPAEDVEHRMVTGVDEVLDDDTLDVSAADLFGAEQEAISDEQLF